MPEEPTAADDGTLADTDADADTVSDSETDTDNDDKAARYRCGTVTRWSPWT